MFFFLFFYCCGLFFFQAEDGIRDLVRSRGLGDVYKRQGMDITLVTTANTDNEAFELLKAFGIPFRKKEVN